MLRHILGHWKAHKRKPSLLPEDIESHSDDPSKVNPLFEDSEGSIASSPRHDGDRNSTTGIDLDLVDVSIPKETNEEKSDALEETPDDVINRIDIALDSSFINDKDSSEEQLKSSPEVARKETETFSNPDKKAMVQEKSESSENQPRMSRLHQIMKTHPELKKELVSDITIFKSIPNKTSESKSNQQISGKENQLEVSTDASAKSEQSSEQTAIPSTSTGITDGSSKHSNTSPVTSIPNNSPVLNMSSSSTPATNRDLNSSSISNESSSSTKTSSTTTASNKDSNITPVSDSNAPFVSVKEPVSETKPKSFKKRAIDELIKKFQGSNSENVQKVSSFLHSNNKKETLDDSKSKDKTESESAAIKKEQDKESLSKIFSFPPPPPAEPKKNNSKKEKDVLPKATKVAATSESVSKIDSNFILTEAKTRTDSSLSRKDYNNRTVATNDVPNVLTSKQKEEKGKQTETKKERLIAFQQNQWPESITTSTEAKSTIEKLQKPNDIQTKSSRSTVSQLKTSASKTESDITTPKKDPDATKSHSEDSGITRGDQISSEVSPDVPKEETKNENDVTASTPTKRNTRERRTMHNRNRGCKRCKRFSYDGEAPLKRSQCDDYYDVLTGLYRAHKSKYSDSWTSDLSHEERDLIRRLRSRRDTLRSNGLSGKSRHPRHTRNPENGHFHRHHPVRRSLSDESTFNSSMCSCDDCWLFLVKDYAYGRASLRGMARKG
ncbi:uncharacterized protein CEXT_18581 [Caerostris extrusa]|uniref:Uncharacterized protein n=1 Tax=Caerostris extrusa TaxID=172846 RepID=A0AAV4RH92_CAEEX|nr:uncharacterized protein CEXT_18581 [Caerostris extrusa]